jgi:hypothetical protein
MVRTALTIPVVSASRAVRRISAFAALSSFVGLPPSWFPPSLLPFWNFTVISRDFFAILRLELLALAACLVELVAQDDLSAVPLIYDPKKSRRLYRTRPLFTLLSVNHCLTFDPGPKASFTL